MTNAGVLARLAAAVAVALLAAACGDAWREEAPSAPARTTTPAPTSTVARPPAPVTPAPVTPAPPPTSTVAATPRAALLDTFGDGHYEIGADIAPGRYRTTTPTRYCQVHSAYARVVFPKVSAIVDVRMDDGFLRTENCGIWSTDLSPIVKPGESFGEGVFLVGSEIAPGRYRTTTPSPECWWMRLRHFAPGEGARAGAESHGGASAIADIAPSDAGFYSERCGTWSADLSPVVRPAESFGEGAFLVGAEIATGRYRTTTPALFCVWDRLNSFSGSTLHAGFRYDSDSLGSVVFGGGLSNGVGLEGIFYGAGLKESASAIVDIGPSDTGFLSSNCGTWSTDLTPIVAPGQPFGNGSFLVGPEIGAGAYAADGGYSDCEWMRLSGFGGTAADVVAQNRTAHVVVIEETDAGFFSHRCGTWSRLTPRIAPGEAFGDGLFLVGPEVAPGRYRAASPTASCRWRRLDGLGGVIASGASAEGAAALAAGIAPDDAGFSSDGCGQWTPAPQPPALPSGR